MKMEYTQPETEVIRYPDEDIILTSSRHHCGTGIVTHHDYMDTTGDTYCDTDDNYHCGGGSGDYSCTEFGSLTGSGTNSPSNACNNGDCTDDGDGGCEEDCEEVSNGT